MVYESRRFPIREKECGTAGKKKREKEYCRMGNRDEQTQFIDLPQFSTKCNNLLLKFWEAHLTSNLFYEAHTQLVVPCHNVILDLLALKTEFQQCKKGRRCPLFIIMSNIQWQFETNLSSLNIF